MNVTIMPNDIDISELESLILKDGKIIPVSYYELSRFSTNQLAMFGHKYAIYQYPTTELLDFINSEIDRKPAIEIGSGNGCIGRNLGIKMTDNKQQEFPEIAAYYRLTGQPTITYGEDVEKIDANSAVKKYNPEVVVACWVTHKWASGGVSGNMHGPEEELMFENGVKKYIHVGNSSIHKDKPILKKIPMKKVIAPWVISRSVKPEFNVIYIFSR